jgi:hypothetical protein
MFSATVHSVFQSLNKGGYTHREHNRSQDTQSVYNLNL